MSKLPPRYTVTIDRLDGGEPIEDREVHEVQLRSGFVTIHDGKTTIFAGEAWNWLEVRQIDYAASVALDLQAVPRARGRAAVRPLLPSK